ncbi:hypothetical protein FACS1894172_13850 [Spirochaetia bacterium]|nr:hypothetical protein FACS1894164_08830 [Spirochaetia bacterium]GHU34081.1 hypothetical protein FACS1894172_13850 [Spirochaetia bacterium]
MKTSLLRSVLGMAVGVSLILFGCASKPAEVEPEPEPEYYEEEEYYGEVPEGALTPEEYDALQWATTASGSQLSRTLKATNAEEVSEEADQARIITTATQKSLSWGNDDLNARLDEGNVDQIRAAKVWLDLIGSGQLTDTEIKNLLAQQPVYYEDIEPVEPVESEYAPLLPMQMIDKDPGAQPLIEDYTSEHAWANAIREWARLKAEFYDEKITPRVAFLPFSGALYEDGQAVSRLLSYNESFRTNFIMVPNNSVVEQVWQNERENQKIVGNATEVEERFTNAEVARSQGINYIVSGYVTTSATGSNVITAGLFDFASMRQISGSTRTYTNASELPARSKEIADELVANFISYRELSNKPTLAAGDVIISGSDVSNEQALLIGQILAGGIADSGRYQVYPRTGTKDFVLAQYRNAGKGTPTEDGTISTNEIEYLLTVSVNKLGNQNRLMGEIVSLADNSMREYGSVNYTETTIAQNVQELLDQMLSSRPDASGRYTDRANLTSANFVSIPGNLFNMGSINRSAGESPVRLVRLSAFAISKTEVTQKEFLQVMNTNPSFTKGDDLPVENVTWEQAIQYCNALSIKENLEPAYEEIRDENGSLTGNYQLTFTNGYRLPTEAEWEYVASLVTDSAESTAWYSANAGGKTHAVGTSKVNSLGLYDLYGNVGEWCFDWYGPYVAADSSDTALVDGDAVNQNNGVARVWRGGSYNSPVADLRPARRRLNLPSVGFRDIGFRIVRSTSGR